jgi:hypothetical protein
MKITVLIILLSIYSKFSFGQDLIFVDQSLKNYLFSTASNDLDGDEIADAFIDINGDNEIQLVEALAIENLIIGPAMGIMITSIEDISQFINLKRLSVLGSFGLINISNLSLGSLEHIRISDHNSITEIDLSDLPSLNSIFIEGLNGLNSLNLQNGSHATQNFSLFYTYFNSACVDSIAAEYNQVALHLLNDEIPSINCALGIRKQEVSSFQIYPNPIENEVSIQTKLTLHRYEIYNLQGMKMQSGLLQNNKIDLSNIMNGTYILAIEAQNGERYNHKIVKNN